jgi:ppGpp synthetase/RelA/SpoT-type nucleotidyltranferase
MTPSQIDRLGDRLRKGVFTADDARLLSEYRESFSEAVDSVADYLSRLVHTNDTITKRTAKSTISIIAKIQRERTRLSTMQDVGGMRVVVSGVVPQEYLLRKIQGDYPQAVIDDKRDQPSQTGYRAVHVIVRENGRNIEIQIRTKMQNEWAQSSEKLADRYGIEIKYGGGSKSIRELLIQVSQGVQSYEIFEKSVIELGCSIALSKKKARDGQEKHVPDALTRSYDETRHQLQSFRNLVRTFVERAASL